jgi:hypothetical protein
VIDTYGHELGEEVESSLPKIVRLVLEGIELRPGDSEVLADALITDLDRTEARLGVATFSLDELAARYPNLGLVWKREDPGPAILFARGDIWVRQFPSDGGGPATEPQEP